MNPTWSTFSSGMWAEQQLHFSLRLMTGGLGDSVGLGGGHLQEGKSKTQKWKNKHKANKQKKLPFVPDGLANFPQLQI